MCVKVLHFVIVSYVLLSLRYLLAEYTCIVNSIK